jgi:hypothetical protein
MELTMGAETRPTKNMKKPVIEADNGQRQRALSPATCSADDVTIEVVSGVEGLCLSINNTRVAGPKPWGGGRVIMSWKTKASRITESLPNTTPTVKNEA